MKIAVGDEVRVHFHPPGSMQSFFEGVVARVDLKTPHGRFFVVDVRHEVILDRENRIRSGFKDFVRYECRNDFPSRIEILSTIDQDVRAEPAPTPTAVEAPEAATRNTHEQSEPQVDTCRGLEPPAEGEAKPFRVHLERQPAPQRSGLIAALLGRRK